MNKYKLTTNTKQLLGKTLYQIQALKDFGDVKEGELGGWVEKESSLSQEGLCWVYDNARVSDNALVFGNAQMYDYAQVYGDAWVYGNAFVFGDAWVFGNVKVYDIVWGPAAPVLEEGFFVAHGGKMVENKAEAPKKKPTKKKIEKPSSYSISYIKGAQAYAEEHQPNPLRWCILTEKSPKRFENITNWFVCKDFFNDAAVSIHTGVHFTKYGFTLKDKPLPTKRQSLFVAVDRTKKNFLANTRSLELPRKVHVVPSNAGFILKIPAYYHKNTYRLSLLTLAIRLCNRDDLVNIWETKPGNEKDTSLWEKVCNTTLFNAITDTVANKYIWYTTEHLNSRKNKEVSSTITSLIHDNGLSAWQTTGLLV